MTALVVALCALCLWLVLRLHALSRWRDRDLGHMPDGWLEAMRRREAIHSGDGWR